MIVKCKDIKGLMDDKIKQNKPPYNSVYDAGYVSGYNKRIALQGEKGWTLNREKLARSIHQFWRNQGLETGTIGLLWEELHDSGREGYYEEADAILANLPDMIEVVG